MDDLSERRKDSKGRVLRTGESERKDGLYQFRYEDISGKRQTIYDRDLNELRKKEKESQKQLDEVSASLTAVHRCAMFWIVHFL